MVITINVSQVIEFLLWGPKLVKFWANNEHTPRILLYYVKGHNAESTKIGHDFRKLNV